VTSKGEGSLDYLLAGVSASSRSVLVMFATHLPTLKGWKPELGHLFKDLNLESVAWSWSCVGEQTQPHLCGSCLNKLS